MNWWVMAKKSRQFHFYERYLIFAKNLTDAEQIDIYNRIRGRLMVLQHEDFSGFPEDWRYIAENRKKFLPKEELYKLADKYGKEWIIRHLESLDNVIPWFTFNENGKITTAAPNNDSLIFNISMFLDKNSYEDIASLYSETLTKFVNQTCDEYKAFIDKLHLLTPDRQLVRNAEKEEICFLYIKSFDELQPEFCSVIPNKEDVVDTFEKTLKSWKTDPDFLYDYKRRFADRFFLDSKKCPILAYCFVRDVKNLTVPEITFSER